MEPVEFYYQPRTATEKAWRYFYIVDADGNPVTVEAMPDEPGMMGTWSARDFASGQGPANDAFRKILEGRNAHRT